MPTIEEFAALWNADLPPLPPGWAPPPEFNAGGVAQLAAPSVMDPIEVVTAIEGRTLQDEVAEKGFYGLSFVPVFGGDESMVWPIPLEVTVNGIVAAT
jgi:hypothetical protein